MSLLQRNRARWMASLIVAGSTCCASPPADPVRSEFGHEAMGTRFRVVVFAADARAAERAAFVAFERVDELERALSDWNAASELRRLDALTDADAPTEPVAVSADLARVLGLALEVAAQSNGAFDPTVGPFVRLWRRAARQGTLPTEKALAEAARSVGHSLVELDRAACTVRLKARAMRLDLGGIAKGDAAEAALKVLREHGFDHALVDAGGDLALGEPPPGAAAWRIALEPFGTGAPVDREVLLLANAFVATSGDAARFVELDGERHSPIVDPRTGIGLTRRVAATVVAQSGALADALASALCVLGADEGLALVERLPDVEARVVELVPGENSPRTCDSSGFRRMMGRANAVDAFEPRPGHHP